MQRVLLRQRTMVMAVGIACGWALGGCRAPSPTQNETSEAVNNHVVVKTTATKAPAKGALSNKAQTTAPEKVVAKPTPTATMTVSQAMGVGILKAINANSGMAGHKISVGTGPGTVWLDGSVAKAAQKTLAEDIAKSKAPQAKVVNRLTIGSPVTAAQKNAKQGSDKSKH